MNGNATLLEVADTGDARRHTPLVTGAFRPRGSELHDGSLDQDAQDERRKKRNKQGPRQYRLNEKPPNRHGILPRLLSCHQLRIGGWKAKTYGFPKGFRTLPGNGFDQEC